MRVRVLLYSVFLLVFLLAITGCGCGGDVSAADGGFDAATADAADVDGGGRDAPPLTDAFADAAEREDAGNEDDAGREGDAARDDAGFSDDAGHEADAMVALDAGEGADAGDGWDGASEMDDAGPVDAGPVDAGPVDAGASVDAGMLPRPWARALGDEATTQVGHAIVTDAEGNAFIVGYFDGTIDFGGTSLTSAGSTDMFVARYDAYGNLIWARRFGDRWGQYGQGIALDERGDVVVTGYFGGTIDFGGGSLMNSDSAVWDLFVAKLDRDDGSHIWSRRFGDAGGNEEGVTVDVDGMGRIVVCGQYSGSPDLGGGTLPSAVGRRILLIQLDSDGTHRWSRGWGAGTGRARCGSADASGTRIVVTGTFDTALDITGTSMPSSGGRDGFIALLDDGGTVLWSRIYGDAQDQQGRRVAFTPDGDIVFVTYFQGSLDVGCGVQSSTGMDDALVARFDSMGNCEWVRVYGGSGAQYPDSLAVTRGGDILFGGRFEGATRVGDIELVSAGMRDHWITRLRGDGALLWTASYGDENQQDQLYLAPGLGSQIFITGTFAGTVDYGSGPITSGGGQDAFIALIER
jgi:hypothetical protein